MSKPKNHGIAFLFLAIVFMASGSAFANVDKNDELPSGPTFASIDKDDEAWTVGLWQLEKTFPLDRTKRLSVGTRPGMWGSWAFNVPSANMYVRSEFFLFGRYTELQAGIVYADLRSRLPEQPFHGLAIPFRARYTVPTKKSITLVPMVDGAGAIGFGSVSVDDFGALRGLLVSTFIRPGMAFEWQSGSTHMGVSVHILPNLFLLQAVTGDVQIDDQTSASIFIRAAGFKPFPFGTEVSAYVSWPWTKDWDVTFGVKAGNIAFPELGAVWPEPIALPYIDAVTHF